MEISFYRIILYGLQIDKLKNFYIDHFNLELVEEIKDEWVVLKSGQVEIAFHKIGRSYIPHNEEGFRVNSNTKIVFRIDQDLATFKQELLDKGVALKNTKSFKGINSLFCDGQDPEGNVFQLEQRLDADGK